MNIWMYGIICAFAFVATFVWAWYEFNQDTTTPAIIIGVVMVATAIISDCLMWVCFIVFGG